MQHVRKQCNKTPGKSLWQLSQTVQGVEVGALPIPGQRFTVQLNAIDRLQTGNIKIAEGEKKYEYKEIPPILHIISVYICHERRI